MLVRAIGVVSRKLVVACVENTLSEIILIRIIRQVSSSSGGAGSIIRTFACSSAKRVAQSEVK